jgi:hypothetical protein
VVYLLDCEPGGHALEEHMLHVGRHHLRVRP